ncbi:MAG: hypothetical protein ACE364_08145 [Chlorobiota bacterium]
MKSYEEKFKNLKDSELIEIIQNRNQFDEVAIEAAENELSERGIEASKSKSSANDNAPNKFISKLKGFAHDIHLSIVRKGKYEKIIGVMTVFLLLSYLYNLYNDLSFTLFILSDGLFDIFTFLKIAEIIAFPLFLWLLWNKRKWGWIIFELYFSNIVIMNLIFVIIYWEQTPFWETDNEITTVADFLFYIPPLYTNVVKILFYLGLLLILFKSQIRDLFNIDIVTIKRVLSFNLLIALVYYIIT